MWYASASTARIPLNRPVGFVERIAVSVNTIAYAHKKIIHAHMFGEGYAQGILRPMNYEGGGREYLANQSVTQVC